MLDARTVRRLRLLVASSGEVGRVCGREPWREVLLWLSRGRWPRRTGWPSAPRLDTPWQDTVCRVRPGWRTRAANLRHPDGDAGFAFAVDYQTCARCRLGWVEQPYTYPPYQRHGLARAGLAALRVEHPGLSWHTLGGHFRASRPFWDAVGIGVPGGYRQRKLCAHAMRG